MVLTLIVAGIASALLLFGTAIPQLRGNITMARDLEFPDGISVSVYQCCGNYRMRVIDYDYDYWQLFTSNYDYNYQLYQKMTTTTIKSRDYPQLHLTLTILQLSGLCYYCCIATYTFISI